MRKLLTISIPLLLILMLFSCDFHYEQKRELKPYDPDKAGAAMVKSFNITDQIRYDKNLWLDFYEHDIAEYNNAIYIYSYGVIYVFDKDTFDKINEIKLRTYAYSAGLAITADGYAFLLLGDSQKDLLSLDLKTGDEVWVDDPVLNELIFEDEQNINGYIEKMGYNRADNTIWFQIWQNSERYFLFFRYNAEDESFVFLGQKKDDSVSSLSMGWYYKISAIYGNICWFTGSLWGYYPEQKIDVGISGSSRDLRPNKIIDVGIRKYSLENMTEELHFIDVEYLNTLTIPYTSYYDGEHIWVIVERDNQIQMLKLLPNE